MKSNKKIKKIGIFSLCFVGLAGITTAVATSCSASSIQPDFISSLNFTSGSNGTYKFKAQSIVFDDSQKGLSSGTLSDKKKMETVPGIELADDKNDMSDIKNLTAIQEATNLNSQFRFLYDLSAYMMNFAFNSSDLLSNLGGYGKGDSNLLSQLNPSDGVKEVVNRLLNFQGDNAQVKRYRVKSIEFKNLDISTAFSTAKKYNELVEADKLDGDKVKENELPMLEVNIGNVDLVFDYWHTENGQDVIWNKENTEQKTLTVKNLKANLEPGTVKITKGPNKDKFVYSGSYVVNRISKKINDKDVEVADLKFDTLDTTSDEGAYIISGLFLNEAIGYSRGDYTNSNLETYFKSKKSLFEKWINTFN